MEERIRQRRALFTVLQEWLEESSLMEALVIFEDHFQGRPTIAVHDYLTRIAPLYQDRVDAKTLRRNLMQVLVTRTQDLAPDPLPQLEKFRKQQSSGPDLRFNAQPTPQQLALHSLVSAMMHKVPLTQRKQLHVHIAQQLKTRFRNGSYDLLSQYMLADNPLYLAGFDDRALRDFLSLIYVAACEVLGPVAADRWLGGCIADLRTAEPANAEAVNRYL